MSRLIQKNLKNKKTELPAEMQQVKDQLANFQIKTLWNMNNTMQTFFLKQKK